MTKVIAEICLVAAAMNIVAVKIPQNQELFVSSCHAHSQ